MEAYRFKNLVYVPLPKHASKSYIYLFSNVLGWERTETCFVDWETDKVFAHLVHPITRYIKGSVQALTQNNLAHLVDLPDFAKLVSTSCFFDRHAYPLSVMLPLELCYKMEWLLLDHHLVTGEKFTQGFLRSHGIDITTDMIPKFNTSTVEKKIVAKKIKSLVDANNAIDSLIFFLQEDLNLYNQVHIHTHFYNLESKPWTEISYLTNYVEKHGYEHLKKTRFNLQP